MNMFARFDENPAMTLRVIKETKRYGRTDGRTHGRTHGRTDGQRENSIPPTNKVCGGYNKTKMKRTLTFVDLIVGLETTTTCPDVAWEQNYVNTISW